MAKQRYVNTKIWSDSWIRKLKPLGRYLFLYLLTNEHTNISGIYELPLETMSFETGLVERELKKIILKLKPKVYYLDGWVYLVNFQKHQSTTSEKVQTGIKVEMKKIPQKILYKIKEIGCIYPIDTLSNPIIYPNTNSNLNSNTNSNEKLLTFKKGERWGEKPYYVYGNKNLDLVWKDNKWLITPQTNNGEWNEYNDKESLIKWK